MKTRAGEYYTDSYVFFSDVVMNKLKWAEETRLKERGNLIFHIEKYFEAKQRPKLCFTKTLDFEESLVISLGWINKCIFTKTFERVSFNIESRNYNLIVSTFY